MRGLKQLNTTWDVEKPLTRSSSSVSLDLGKRQPYAWVETEGYSDYM